MSKKKANATLIGAFAVLGLGLLIAAVIAAGGGKLFARKEQVVMHFSGSIYGLQVGAPVNFRGVRLGSVSTIGLVYDKAKDEFIIPVHAELEPDAIRGLADAEAKQAVLPGLISRGLRAQLSMQSLLTGQLYVDLDLRPQKPAVLRGTENGGALEIPTTATAIQQLKNQIDGLDFRRLLDDISAIASSARTVIAGPQLKQVMDDLSAITGHVRRVSARLDARVIPLTEEASTTLADARRAADKLGKAADGVGDTAKRVGTAADRYKALVEPESPLLASIQKTADELSLTAASLRQELGSDSTLLRNSERAMQDLSRAARSVRELADMLDRQPDALLRGRPKDPTLPEKPR